MSLRDLIERRDEEAPPVREVVVDRRTGQVRQAGATTPEGEFITTFKRKAERSLFVFAKGVFGLTRLTTSLHKPICEWITAVPPKRKLLLMPRDHLKTSIVSRALAPHILIQPRDGNIYFPGVEGRNTRVLLAGETAKGAENQLGWIETRFTSNQTLRALWPQCCWEGDPRQTKACRAWNAQAMMLPRTDDYPEMSIETIGVGGAVTGRHYKVMIKDDLTTLEAANSPTVMETAIQWHDASRALFDDPDNDLEFVIGTRWAVHDLYSHIIDNDPTVSVVKRSVIEDGKIIFPEMFTEAGIAELRRSLGTLFPLLYMNEAADASLVDFDASLLREFRIEGGMIVFDEDERDLLLAEKNNAPTPTVDVFRGAVLTPDLMENMFGRGEYLRFKAR